jgi:hypothetical protein
MDWPTATVFSGRDDAHRAGARVHPSGDTSLHRAVARSTAIAAGWVERSINSEAALQPLA